MKSISVIIPVYNCRKYLEDCVATVSEAIAKCRTTIGEVILVDDGSTDGSSDVCDKLAAALRFENCVIRPVHQENRGVSAARNVGQRMATGEFILFVDADDTVDSQKLADLMETIPQDVPIDMIIFGMAFDYYDGDRIYRQDLMCPVVEGMKTYDECSAILSSLFHQNAISPLWNKLIRRSVIEDAEICLREDMFLYEDLEFSLRVLARCDTVFFCKEPIYHYRQSPDEGNAGRRLKRIAHIPEVVGRIETTLTPFKDATGVLVPLYLILAREKISCATKKEIETVCADFRRWIDEHKLVQEIQNSKYAMLLYRGRSAELLIKKNKTRVRHQIAVFIKKTIGDFRKW